MAQDFNNLSAKDIVTLITRMDDFDAIKETIESLTPDLQKAILSPLEKEMVECIRGNTEEYEEYKLMQKTLGGLNAIFEDAAEKEERKQVEAELVKDLQTAGQILKYIADAKGEAAHPVIKETAKALAELSNADYNRLDGICTALAKGYAAGVDIQPAADMKPNPFRNQRPKQ